MAITSNPVGQYPQTPALTAGRTATVFTADITAIEGEQPELSTETVQSESLTPSRPNMHRKDTESNSPEMDEVYDTLNESVSSHNI